MIDDKRIIKTLVGNNFIMNQQVFFVFLFFIIPILLLCILKDKEKRKLYFEKVDFIQNIYKIKNFKQKNLNFTLKLVNGVNILAKSFAKDSYVLYPLIFSNNCIVKYFDKIRIVDEKINECKLRFKYYNAESVPKFLAKSIVNRYIYSRGGDVLHILHDTKFLCDLSKRELKYTKYMIIEELVLWLAKMVDEVKLLQYKCRKTKYFPSNISSYTFSSCEVYGLLKFHNNATKIIFNNNVNVKLCLEDFFKELDCLNLTIKSICNAINETISDLGF